MTLAEAEALRQAQLPHEARLRSMGALMFLGSIHVIVGPLFFFWSCLRWLSDQFRIEEPPHHPAELERAIMVGIAFTVFGALSPLSGLGLRRLDPRHRALYTTMACAWVLFFPFLSILGLWALYWLHHKATPTVLSVEHQEAQRLTPRLEPPQTFWGRVVFGILVVFVLAALTVPLALYATTVNKL